MSKSQTAHNKVISNINSDNDKKTTIYELKSEKSRLSERFSSLQSQLPHANARLLSTEQTAKKATEKDSHDKNACIAEFNTAKVRRNSIGNEINSIQKRMETIEAEIAALSHQSNDELEELTLAWNEHQRLIASRKSVISDIEKAISAQEELINQHNDNQPGEIDNLKKHRESLLAKQALGANVDQAMQDTEAALEKAIENAAQSKHLDNLAIERADSTIAGLKTTLQIHLDDLKNLLDANNSFALKRLKAGAENACRHIETLIQELAGAYSNLIAHHDLIAAIDTSAASHYLASAYTLRIPHPTNGQLLGEDMLTTHETKLELKISLKSEGFDLT